MNKRDSMKILNIKTLSLVVTSVFALVSSTDFASKSPTSSNDSNLLLSSAEKMISDIMESANRGGRGSRGGDGTGPRRGG